MIYGKLKEKCIGDIAYDASRTHLLMTGHRVYINNGREGVCYYEDGEITKLPGMERVIRIAW
ncbi:hypothetical protein [Kribbella swartbergensis]